MQTTTLPPLSMTTSGCCCYPQSARYSPTLLYDVQDTICWCHDPVSDMSGQVNYLLENSFVVVQRRSHCIYNFCSSGKMLLTFLLPNTPALILPCIYWHHTHCIPYLLAFLSAYFPIIPLSLLLSPFPASLNPLWCFCLNFHAVYAAVSADVLIQSFLSYLRVCFCNHYQHHVSAVIPIHHMSPSSHTSYLHPYRLS